MLQREMDSSVDYGTPLVVSKKGWFQKVFDHKKITESIPVINSKVPDENEFWSKLKYLAHIETPIRIVGVVVLGTLLGAAYAVTLQSSDKQREVSVSALDTQETTAQESVEKSVMPTIVTETSHLSSDILLNENDVSINEALKAPEIKDRIDEFNFSQVLTISEDSEDSNHKGGVTLKSPEINQKDVQIAPAFKLVSTEKSFKITHPKGFDSSKKTIDESAYTAIVIPKELIPDVAEESERGLSEYEQQKISELERKLALAQEKLDKFDRANLKLQGKFEILVVKNRALSNQLRHIDTVTTELKQNNGLN